LITELQINGYLAEIGQPQG